MPDCTACKEKNRVEPVPCLAHESAMARNERTTKRLISALIVVLLLWFTTIGMFIWYINQYDFSAISYQQDGEGINILEDMREMMAELPEDQRKEVQRFVDKMDRM